MILVKSSPEPQKSGNSTNYAICWNGISNGEQTNIALIFRNDLFEKTHSFTGYHLAPSMISKFNLY